ncbi:MAG: 2-succinyl-5-enolpyruvyl-6-hydroxy-3-cyclohexene-1-carboxylic-acid synthase [Bacteroidales bacterium]|nr:2-succinyl-5-enolpyruvyl-6-hydroxy-3-cyclohexene-1-carboxylic-acid synthase [Bacteroidales bacterium]
MYSDKRHILQLTALLREHGVQDFVMCPGGRCAAVTYTLLQVDGFHCHQITDERSAGFFAIGIALQTGRPVAVVCNSGSALLNLFPAVAEAFYQQVPLIVISADHPATSNRQKAEEFVPQINVLKEFVKTSIHLAEAKSEEENLYNNLLINKALLSLTLRSKGPIHINLSIEEPMYRYTVKTLPDERVVRIHSANDSFELETTLNQFTRRMIVVGQMNLIYEFDKSDIGSLRKQFAWLCEHWSNQTTQIPAIRNFDVALCAMNEEQQEALSPQLLITYGGQIASKSLKRLFHKYPPKEHWHVCEDGDVVDMFGCLTRVIAMNPFDFLENVASRIESLPTTFPAQWESACSNTPEPDAPYCGLQAVGKLLHAIPHDCALHLSCGSPLRYAQMFHVPEGVEVCCNGGTNGTEGTLSTALGYASRSSKINFVIIGDLSFFTDMNALLTLPFTANLHIMLLNNKGGECYQNMPGVERSEQARRFLTAEHTASARSWAEHRGFDYLVALDTDDLDFVMPEFTAASTQPMFLEVFTDKERGMQYLREYLHRLKNPS